MKHPEDDRYDLMKSTGVVFMFLFNLFLRVSTTDLYIYF